MGFSVSVPTYMYQSPSGYIFRLRVPNDLRPLVGKSEFRYSLRSGLLHVAKHRARCIASYIHQLYVRIRNSMTEFSPEKIQQLIRDYIRETLKNDEICRSMARQVDGSTKTLEGKTLLEASDMQAPEAKSILTSVKRWLQSQDHSLVEPLVNRVLKDEGSSIKPDTQQYKNLSREFLKGFKCVLEVRIRRSEGDYTQVDEELVPLLAQKGSGDAVMVDNSPRQCESTRHKFSEVQKAYLAEATTAGNWTEKTKAENLAIFSFFIWVMGDKHISEIDKRSFAAFKSLIQRLPPNINKSKKYKGKSVKEILDMEPSKTMSVNSINKYIRRLSALFNFAVAHGYMASNPAESMQMKVKKRMDEEREAYTKEDLEKLFGSEEYRKGGHKHSYAF